MILKSFYSFGIFLTYTIFILTPLIFSLLKTRLKGIYIFGRKIGDVLGKKYENNRKTVDTFKCDWKAVSFIRVS